MTPARRPGRRHRPAQRGLALRLQPGHLRHRRHLRPVLAKGFVELWGLPIEAGRGRATQRLGGVVTDGTPQPTAAVGRPVRRRPVAEALAALSVSVHVRLAAGAVRPGRRPGRTPGCCTAPGCSTDDELDRDARRARRARRPRSPPGTFAPTSSDEDVHTALERGLLERLGALGGKLRAGRSRNDQVATDLRLYLRDHVRALVGRAVVAGGRAARPGRAAPGRRRRPGMTHLQHAQPVLVRATSCWRTCTRSPATSTGCATGTGGPRSARSAPARWPARRCRWTRTRSPPSSASTAAAANSIDAVSDRDFAAEFLLRRGAARRAPVPAGRGGRALDRRREFGWVALDDAYATGSSIMPQKKNPDIAELARGKSGRLIGNLTGLLDHAQGPAAGLRPRPAGGQGAGLRRGRHAAAGAAGGRRHGRDADAATPTGSRPRRRRASRSPPTSPSGWCRRACRSATAHEIVRRDGRRSARRRGLELDQLDDDQLAGIDERLTPDVRSVLSVPGALAARKARGGTAPERVRRAAAPLKALATAHADWARPRRWRPRSERAAACRPARAGSARPRRTCSGRSTRWRRPCSAAGSSPTGRRARSRCG